MDNYECDGQMDIFSMMPKEEPPELLKPGDKVWVLHKVDADEYTVERSAVFKTQTRVERVYHLQGVVGGVDTSYTATNEEINTKVFKSLEKLGKEAQGYMENHPDIIMADDMHPVNVIAYQYVRPVDNKTMTTFFCELDNGMAYVREFMKYGHLVPENDRKSALKRFMNQYEFSRYKMDKLEDFKPPFRNMYRVRFHSDWEYAEAGFSGAIG